MIIICCLILVYIWKKNFEGGINTMFLHGAIRENRIFYGNSFPIDRNFTSLMFSMLRHLVVTVISIVITVRVQSSFVLYIVMIVNVVYIVLKWAVFLARIRIPGIRDGFMKPCVRALTVSQVYATYTYFAFLIVWLII